MLMGTLHTPSQSIPLEWLKAPTEQDRASLIEFARGALCGLSMQDDCFAPVHITRIQRSFMKLGAAWLHKGGLKLIQLLREAEPLHGGYWLPTPYRVVEIEDELVFIGATPNAHGLLGEARMEGLGRLLAPEVADRYPRQSLDSWLDFTSQAPSATIAEFKAAHAHAEARTSNLTGVTYLNLVTSRSTGRSRFHWSDRPVTLLASEGIAICKHSHHGHVRYFSARLAKGVVITEAPIGTSITRLLFAIAHHLGAPAIAVERATKLGLEITLNERLPIEEFRLALLVSRGIARAGHSTTYLISPQLAPAFCSRLVLLGCAMETRQ